MPKYQHDTERWLRSQASLYRASHNRELAGTFTACADEVKRLKAEIAALKEAARPVVNDWSAERSHATDTSTGEEVGYVIATFEELDALVALVGEE